MQLHGNAVGRRAVLALPALGLSRANAQAAWPQRAVRVVVVFSAGSTPDIAARAVVPHLAAAFGQPFIVENRTGAGGVLGTDVVAKATDGHTIGCATNGPTAIARALYRNLPYDPVRDLQPISLLVRAPQILAVPRNSPALDAPGLVALARQRPGALSYGSVGVGATSHLAMEAFKATLGLDMVHVPYRGFPEAVLDLVAGRTDACFAIAAAVLPQIRAGELRALAVTSPQRFSLAPEIPTLREQGLEGLDSLSWEGLIGPANMPAEVAERIAQEAIRAMADERVRGALERTGFEVVGSTPAEFRAVIAREAEESARLIRRLGVEANL